MWNLTCMECGAPFVVEPRRGRKPGFCSGSCRKANRAAYKWQPPEPEPCVSCGECLAAIGRKECSSCEYKKRPRLPCSKCGEPTSYLRGTICANPEEMRCRPCTRESEHGTYAMYAKRGCRCDECKAGAAARMREYAAEYKARTGRSLYSKYRKYDGAHGHFIPRADRLAIYERDDWTCQLCGRPVDKGLHFNDRMAATLDHIEPQSTALIPDHSPENLRLAHRACNSRRNNKAVDEGDALRVRA